MTLADCVVNRSASAVPIASSIVHPAIVEIERKRVAQRISLNELLRRARLDGASYWQLRQGARPRAGTLKRLDDALLGVCYVPPAPAIVAALYRVSAVLCAQARGVPPEDVVALDFKSEKPNSPRWLAAARVRRLAIYVVTVELEVPNADLGRAIGCSRQNVKQARHAVEDWREADPDLEAALTRIASLARGAA